MIKIVIKLAFVATCLWYATSRAMAGDANDTFVFAISAFVLWTVAAESVFRKPVDKKTAYNAVYLEVKPKAGATRDFVKAEMLSLTNKLNIMVYCKIDETEYRAYPGKNEIFTESHLPNR